MSEVRIGPLVRSIHPDAVAIWSEWSQPCEVVLIVTPINSQQEACSTCTRTVNVGGRYFALSRVSGLQPATWYNYTLRNSASSPGRESELLQCFRTLDVPDAKNPLRLAYGSCRKLSDMQPDAFSAFGSWLLHHQDERESLWPRFLLMIGDQIYADEYVEKPGKGRFARVQSFEDFARIYTETWTSDDGIRQVFAALPTYMIFDDHEITNAWNLWPAWRARALAHGIEQTLVDGLVAYWVYQGWGNIGLQSADEHVLLNLMRQGEQSGEDMLEALREQVRKSVYEETSIRWHYEISTSPPLFIMDARADRPAILNGSDPTSNASRILSQEQMEQLTAWMQAHADETTVLVSSVPALLPPVIGLAEYVAGARPFQHAAIAPLRRLGKMLAARQQKLALGMSFDHWPVFNATWRELVHLFKQRQRDLVILSGDVHFSYAMVARSFPSRKRARLYQLVASPFRNALGRRDKRLIVWQSYVKRAIYGGLSSSILPLREVKTEKRVPRDMLFQNVVAMVTFWPKDDAQGKHIIRQMYLGSKDGELEEVATSVVP